jgi:hypothetical protein
MAKAGIHQRRPELFPFNGIRRIGQASMYHRHATGKQGKSRAETNLLDAPSNPFESFSGPTVG